jgi:hypothetical protein
VGEQSSCYPGKLAEYALKAFESASGFAKETADNLITDVTHQLDCDGFNKVEATVGPN